MHFNILYKSIRRFSLLSHLTSSFAPSRNQALFPCRRALGCQTDRLHILVEEDRLFQLDQHDIIVKSLTIKVWMTNHLLCIDQLLCVFSNSQVVLSQVDNELASI